jgi:hypothetical protein
MHACIAGNALFQPYATNLIEYQKFMLAGIIAWCGDDWHDGVLPFVLLQLQYHYFV